MAATVLRTHREKKESLFLSSIVHVSCTSILILRFFSSQILPIFLILESVIERVTIFKPK